MKKEWSKPKLISLYRGRPEEAVLGTCKTETAGVPTSDPGGNNCSGTAGHCSTIATS